MELFVKASTVNIMTLDHEDANYDKKIIHSVQVFPSWSEDENGKRKGIRFLMLFQQHSTKGKYFEMSTDVTLYFSVDLLELTFFWKLLILAQKACINELFDRTQGEPFQIEIQVAELEKEKVAEIYLSLQSE